MKAKTVFLASKLPGLNQNDCWLRSAARSHLPFHTEFGMCITSFMAFRRFLCSAKEKYIGAISSHFLILLPYYHILFIKLAIMTIKIKKNHKYKAEKHTERREETVGRGLRWHLWFKTPLKWRWTIDFPEKLNENFTLIPSSFKSFCFV